MFTKGCTAVEGYSHNATNFVMRTGVSKKGQVSGLIRAFGGKSARFQPTGSRIIITDYLVLQLLVAGKALPINERVATSESS